MRDLHLLRSRIAATCILLALLLTAATQTASGQGSGGVPAEKRTAATRAPETSPKSATRTSRSKQTFAGIVQVAVDSRTGQVISTRMFKSTGDKILDNASVTAMRKAKFKPGTAPLVRVPIAWTLTGRPL